MNDLLTLENLKVEFRVQEGVVEAVRGVSFRVRSGSTLAIVGESGSGKTVISQAIMGILPKAGKITSGSILFRDPAKPGTVVDIARANTNGREMRGIRGGRISIIFQEPMVSLSPLHTIGDQIIEAVRLHRKEPYAAARELTANMLRLVEFPDPQRALDTYPFELSGGLRQRAMIAMALVCRPALLVADEPTTALDVTIQAQILRLIRDLQAEFGMALLIITHDLGVVANIAEDVVVMYHGRVMESGCVEDIFRNPCHPYLQALLRAVPRFGMPPGERLVPIREIRTSTQGYFLRGVGLESAQRSVNETNGSPLLTVQGISHSFSTRSSGMFGFSGRSAQKNMAVDDVSFVIRRGECLGLVGESGCGKTTLSKILMCAIRPDSGGVIFHDHGRKLDVLSLSGNQLSSMRQRVQFVFQDPFSSLNPRMTVHDIISEPMVIHKIGTPRQRDALVQELMTLVGLDTRYLRRYPHSFSGGQRQRICIARALALKPDLLICDEPVSALDVSIQAQILNLLKDFKDKLGLTYLFISHNLAVVDYIADRIMVMCKGSLVELADRGQLFERPVHPYTQALLAAVPEPSLDTKLDFDRLRAERASDPSAWPAPFAMTLGRDARMVEVEGGHFVRAYGSLAAVGAAV